MIYKNNASNIGIINPQLLISIVQFYQLLEAVIQDVKPGGFLNVAPRGIAPFRELLAIGEQMLALGERATSEIERIYRIRNAQQINRAGDE